MQVVSVLQRTKKRIDNWRVRLAISQKPHGNPSLASLYVLPCTQRAGSRRGDRDRFDAELFRLQSDQSGIMDLQTIAAQEIFSSERIPASAL
jgi:hypothetical protein